MRRLWAGLLPLLGCLLPLAGCGGVGIDQNEDSQPLVLLELYPRQGEQNVPVDVQVLAVFSDAVFAADGCQAGLPQAGDFTLQLCPQGQAASNVAAGVTCYQRRDENGQPSGDPRLDIAVLAPNEPLQPQSRYCVSIAGTLAGANSAALGASIESTFTTGQ